MTTDVCDRHNEVVDAVGEGVGVERCRRKSEPAAVGLGRRPAKDHSRIAEVGLYRMREIEQLERPAVAGRCLGRNPSGRPVDMSHGPKAERED